MNPDPAIPRSALLFEPVEDRYGPRLALVFGNEAPGGSCPYFQRQCFHCDIGAGESVRFDTAMNQRRLAFFREHYASVLPKVAHLIIYNSGSVLSPAEFTPASFEVVLAYAASLPDCRVVSLDSREPYITVAHLERVVRLLRADQQPRVILGLETQNDEIRLGVLNKRMTRSAVENAFRAVGQFAGRVGLDLNIVLGLPPLRGEAAIAEAAATARFGLELGEPHKVPVDFNLHPYYPSDIGRRHFPDHPRAEPAAACEAVWRIHEIIAQSGRPSTLFIGWQDEQHDQQQSLRRTELARFRELFRQFNTTQQPISIGPREP